MTNTTNKECKSTIKGFWFDAENGMTQNAFEVVTKYTRSNDVARKLAAKALNVDKNFIIVTDIENKKAVKREYNIEALLMDGYIPRYDECDADAEHTAVKGTVYVYSADIFGYDETDAPFGVHYDTVETAQSFTKVDARASVKMEYEGVFDNRRVVLVNECTKHEFKVWFNVPNDKLNEYIKA